MRYLEDVDPIIDFSIAKGFSDRVVFCQLNIPIQAVVKCTCDLGCQYFELFYHDQISCCELQVEITVLVYAYLIYYLSRDFILDNLKGCVLFENFENLKIFLRPIRLLDDASHLPIFFLKHFSRPGSLYSFLTKRKAKEVFLFQRRVIRVFCPF